MVGYHVRYDELSNASDEDKAKRARQQAEDISREQEVLGIASITQALWLSGPNLTGVKPSTNWGNYSAVRARLVLVTSYDSPYFLFNGGTSH